MTPPSPITPLPSGYELLSSDFLREYGAVEGMKFRHKDAQPDELWLFNTIADIPEIDIKRLDFIAPTGTTAMYSAPLPEVRCVCEGIYGTASVSQSQHDLNCPAHPRNALVRVLPQLLADKSKEQLEGLLCRWMEGSQYAQKEWHPYLGPWPFVTLSCLDCQIAFCLPRHVLDAIEAGKEQFQNPVLSAKPNDRDRASADEPQHPREHIEPNREFDSPDRDHSPSHASGPTDGEMLDWLESHLWVRVSKDTEGRFYLWPKLEPTFPTLRAAIQSAMKDQTK